MLSRMIPKLSLITNHVRFCSTRYLYIAHLSLSGTGGELLPSETFRKFSAYVCGRRYSNVEIGPRLWRPSLWLYTTRAVLSLYQIRATLKLELLPLSALIHSACSTLLPSANNGFAVLALPLFRAEAKRIAHTVKGEKNISMSITPLDFKGFAQLMCKTAWKKARCAEWEREGVGVTLYALRRGRVE